jgi:LytS/YehU family sensor histidine kinase
MQARIPRLSFSVESQIADAAVPPLMLISLVENAIKHGIEPKVGAAHIAVTVRVIETQETQETQETPEPRMLEMRVEDDGVGLAVTTVALALAWRISISG